MPVLRPHQPPIVEIHGLGAERPAKTASPTVISGDSRVIVQINSEVKALATGDPRILEKARVDAEMTRLERLERAHTRNQRMLSATITDAETEHPKLQAERQLIEDAMRRRVDTSGDKFTMQVAGHDCSSRADAAIALRHALAAIGPAPEHAGVGQLVILGSVGGFTVAATAQRYLQPHLRLELVDVPRSSFTVSYDELRADKPLGIITRLENKTHELDRTRATIAGQAANVNAEADRARADYGQPFTHRQALLDARTRSAELAAELAEPDRHPPAADVLIHRHPVIITCVDHRVVAAR